MITSTKITLYFISLFLMSSTLWAQKSPVSKTALIFSAIKGTASKADTLKVLTTKGNVKSGDLKLSGDHADFFKIVSPGMTLSNKELVIFFQPDVNFIGIARAVLKIGTFSVNLTGLSTKGLEGENEAALAMVVDALGYTINVGWTSLANHLRPELQGEEIAPAGFKKATEGNVEMIPVARYSPDFPLNFGYYTTTDKGVAQHQVGILSKAGKFPEHQTLFPSLDVGQTSFDPGDKPFGFYAISPTHTVYSEDLWNILFYPTHATHAMRIYPVRDKQGVALMNTYLVCMEEAANGDYNDYVFIVKNIEPIFQQQEFTSLMNGNNLDGWYIWLEGKGRNNDPEKIFTLEADGILHDMGKELGYIMTEKSFGNYHFKLEFKWGEKKWPPRQNTKRDSGICYNVPGDEQDQIWPRSVECQIQEGDTGDFWLLGYSTIQVDGKQNSPYKHSQVVKKKDGEKQSGEWNTVEVISFNGKCAHIVNGVLVNYGENSSLVGGRILLQSEFAEVYYRNIRIREL